MCYITQKYIKCQNCVSKICAKNKNYPNLLRGALFLSFRTEISKKKWLHPCTSKDRWAIVGLWNGISRILQREKKWTKHISKKEGFNEILILPSKALTKTIKNSNN